MERLVFLLVSLAALQQVNNYLVNGDCPTGEVLRSCGTPCQGTCFNYNQTYECPDVCVIDQCECPTGLVRYRERCVDPLECPSLLQSPPSLNPLPMPSDTLLIQFIASNLSKQEYYNQSRQNRFKSDVERYLVEGGVTTPTIITYDIITNKSDLDILLTIKSDSIPSDISPDQVVNILQAQIDSLSVNISYITRVTSPYSGSSNDGTAILIVAIFVVLSVILASVFILSVIVLKARKCRAPAAVDQSINYGSTGVSKPVTLTEDDKM